MQSSVRDAVLSSLAKLTGVAESAIADADDLFDDLGVDSMMSVNLLMEVEDRLKARLPDGSEGSFVDVRTVGELMRRFDGVFARAGRSSKTGIQASVSAHERVGDVPRTHD